MFNPVNSKNVLFILLHCYFNKYLLYEYLSSNQSFHDHYKDQGKQLIKKV